MKPGKVLCVCFCWLFWGLTLHKTAKCKGGYVPAPTTKHVEKLRLCNSCIVDEPRTKDVLSRIFQHKS